MSVAAHLWTAAPLAKLRLGPGCVSAAAFGSPPGPDSTVVLMARITLGEWLVRRAPTDADRAREAMFIADHWTYGAMIHTETAKALVARLDEPSETVVGHTLFIRLFAEFVNALESLGAWGWTLRTRRSDRLFMDAFLAYPHSAPGDFFRAVQAQEGDDVAGLCELLAVPEVEVVGAMQNPWTGWDEEEVRGVLKMALSGLRQSANQYLVGDQVLLTHYNKAKHGATMMCPPELTDPREFHVIAPHVRLEGDDDSTRYDIGQFRVDKTMIGRVSGNIETVTGMITLLAAMTRAMHDSDLLYVR
jgi:hypothetical protein